MMHTLDEILTAARKLPPQDRARLMASLQDAIAPEDWPLPSGAWTAEANRRCAAYDAGTEAAIPWEEARAQARKAAGLE